MPAQITTDQLSSDATALARVPELAATEHLRVRAARRCNTRVEQAHQPTRVRERRMRRFKSSASAERFLDGFSRVANLFRPRRHLLSADQYGAPIRERVAIWHDVASLRTA